jgi:glycosyltransferase involved in cell wall biosynthesis
MIYLAFPLGTVHGWGVCGRMITRELAKLSPVELYTQPLHPELVQDELEYVFLRSVLPTGADPMNPPMGKTVDAPVAQGIPGVRVHFRPELRGRFNVGYTFFEEHLPKNLADTSLGKFDHIVAGSSWCAEKLREAGCSAVSVILQGVETRYFNSLANEKHIFRDKFVVFSGGKLEYRKGQDLVIRAFASFQQRHPRDVMLVNAWSNPWNWNANTIGVSRHIRVPNLSGDHAQVINQLLAFNGVDVSGGNVISLFAKPNPLMAAIYKNTDVGLFLSRCEGGTNLVLMEYMACGKPAIASFHTGHRDVLTDENSLPLRSQTPQPVYDENQRESGLWNEQDLDEVVEKLEWCYQNRDALRPIGERAANDMAAMTWSATAKQFYDLLMAGNA